MTLQAVIDMALFLMSTESDRLVDTDVTAACNRLAAEFIRLAGRPAYPDAARRSADATGPLISECTQWREITPLSCQYQWRSDYYNVSQLVSTGFLLHSLLLSPMLFVASCHEAGSSSSTRVLSSSWLGYAYIHTM